MTQGFREWIARLVCPEFARTADLNEAKVTFMTRQADDLARWCYNHVPVAAECGEWLLRSTRVHFMPLAEFQARAEKKDWARNEPIDVFRENLKRLQATSLQPTPSS